uniref:Uncharacterized protein n=2 Tax=Meloidogyne enterolobii TaxID=390850 RepID=A0A6V7XXE7_MELEN|nr:unnamed protein product [Meloidogyne enterolobii]
MDLYFVMLLRTFLKFKLDILIEKMPISDFFLLNKLPEIENKKCPEKFGINENWLCTFWLIAIKQKIGIKNWGRNEKNKRIEEIEIYLKEKIFEDLNGILENKNILKEEINILIKLVNNKEGELNNY